MGSLSDVQSGADLGVCRGRGVLGHGSGARKSWSGRRPLADEGVLLRAGIDASGCRPLGVADLHIERAVGGHCVRVMLRSR